MKCVCTHRCQFGGIVRRGDFRDLTELELASPQLKASFRPVADEAPKSADPPLRDAKGKALPPNAQMTIDALKERLTSMGVRFPDTAQKPELFALLQDTLKPETSPRR